MAATGETYHRTRCNGLPGGSKYKSAPRRDKYMPRPRLETRRETRMPLTWGNVTVASRIMLPTYVALTTTIGLVYTLDPGNRLESVHALAAQRLLMPMWIWGVMFLTVAAVMASALLTHRRTWFVFALYLCGATFIMWAALYAWSVALDPQTSFLAPAYPLFVVAACRASARSLLRGEV